MDSQKFNFLACGTHIPELVLASTDILMDIKNTLSLMQYYGNLIGCNVSKFDEPASKVIMDESVTEMLAAGARYKLYCQQYKLIRDRIIFLKKISPEQFFFLNQNANS